MASYWEERWHIFAVAVGSVRLHAVFFVDGGCNTLCELRYPPQGDSSNLWDCRHKEAQFSLEETHTQPGGTSRSWRDNSHRRRRETGLGTGYCSASVKKQLLVAGGTVHRPVLGRLE